MQEVRAHGWAKVEQCRSNCREPCREQLPRFVTQKLGVLDARYELMNRSEVPQGSFFTFDSPNLGWYTLAGVLSARQVRQGIPGTSVNTNFKVQKNLIPVIPPHFRNFFTYFHFLTFGNQALTVVGICT